MIVITTTTILGRSVPVDEQVEEGREREGRRREREVVDLVVVVDLGMA